MTNTPESPVKDADPAQPEPMFSIPYPLAQQIVDYLQRRPWQEVAHLMAGIQQHNTPKPPS